MGATHDLSSSSRGDGHFYYSHAYCWDRAESGSCDGTCRRSVLAYAACVTEKNLCSDCVRYPYISNPDVFEAGSATGVANLFDNAKTIRSTAAKASALQDSLQVGGMVFSVAPNVFDSTRAHFQVEIIGWYIGEGSDITKVWLAGVPVAEIVSQTRDRVTVIPGEAGGKDRFGDVVIYQSGLGINTTFQNGFTYRISNITYMIFEDFEGSVTTFVPAQELSFYYISASCTTGLHCINRGGFTADGVYAALEVDGTGRNGAFMAKFSNNGCFDTISAISVDYFAFSIHPQCYSPGFLTLQVKFEPSGQWVVVGSATSVQATASDEWRTLSTEPTFTPSVVYDVQVLISSYSSIDNCDWHNPVSLDNIKIVYTAECMPPAYVPSAAPSVSFTPIASPSLTPTIRPTYMTETIAFIPGRFMCDDFYLVKFVILCVNRIANCIRSEYI